jgi:hypothetical protein
MRAAATDRRVGAVIAVTPPYDPRPWIDAINPLVAQQLVSLAGQAPAVPVLIADFSLPDVVGRIRCPALIFGAARDLIVPPDESVKLTAALGDLGTLVWYPDSTHGLYDRVDDWAGATADWLGAIFDFGLSEALDVDEEPESAPVSEVTPSPSPAEPSTQVERADAPDREAEFTDVPEPQDRAPEEDTIIAVTMAQPASFQAADPSDELLGAEQSRDEPSPDPASEDEPPSQTKRYDQEHRE